MEYEVKQKLSFEDYMAYVNNQLISYFFRPLNIVMYGLIVAYALYAIIIEGSLFVLAILVGLGALNYLMILTTRRRAKKFYNENENMIAMELVFKEDQLVYKNADGELSKFWYEFTAAKETEKHIFLSLKGSGGLIFVKDAAAPEAVAFLKERMKKFMNPKKVKLQ